MTHRPAHEVELYKDGDCYRVFVDLPGFENDDVEVRWVDRRIVISAERSDGCAEKSSVFHHSMGVPRPVRADDITATYRDGVLDVELPIADETESPGERIAVQE